MKIDCRKDSDSVVYSLNDVTLKDAWECWRNPSYAYLTTLRRPLAPAMQPDIYIDVVNRLDWITSVLASSLKGLVNAAVLAKMEARGEVLPAWEDIPAAMRDGLGLDRIKFPRQFLARFVGEPGPSYRNPTRRDGEPKLIRMPRLGLGLRPGQLWWIGGSVEFPSHPTTIF